MRDSAIVLHEIHLAYQEAGFTPAESLELCKVILVAGWDMNKKTDGE